MSNRINAQQFEQAMAQYAFAAQREAELHSIIATEYSDITDRYKAELAVLQQARRSAFDTAKIFCEQNKHTLFRTRRSIGTMHGVAGFRLGTPRLRTASGTEWKEITALLKQQLPDYVRTTEEPARDMLLAHRHKEHVAPVLLQAGIHVVQDELFYIEPDNMPAERQAAVSQPQTTMALPIAIAPTETGSTKKAA